MTTDIFSKFAMTTFALGGLVLMTGSPGMFPAFYQLRIMGALALLYAFLIALPSLVFRPSDDPKGTAFAQKLNCRAALQASIALAVTLDGAGGLGLYRLHRLGFEYDKLSHFTVALVLSVTVGKFLFSWCGMSLRKSVAVSGAVLLFGEGLWELAEYLLDVFFHTTAFGQDGKEVLRDTFLDVSCDLLGMFAGLSMLVMWKKKGNGLKGLRWEKGGRDGDVLVRQGKKR
jgi:hypothetical protein